HGPEHGDREAGVAEPREDDPVIADVAVARVDVLGAEVALTRRDRRGGAVVIAAMPIVAIGPGCGADSDDREQAQDCGSRAHDEPPAMSCRGPAMSARRVKKRPGAPAPPA